MSLQTIFEGDTSTAPSIAGNMIVGGMVYGQGPAVGAGGPPVTLSINLSNASTAVLVPPAVTVANAVFIDTEEYIVSYSVYGSQLAAAAPVTLQIIYDPVGQAFSPPVNHIIDLSADAQGLQVISGTFKLIITGAGAGTTKTMDFVLDGATTTQFYAGSTVTMMRTKRVNFN